MNLDKWVEKARKEEGNNPAQKYPIIWKTERCPEGACRDTRTSHRWSVPCSTPAGLMTECYDCHKTRIIKTDSDPDLWINKEPMSDFVKQRLAGLQRK